MSTNEAGQTTTIPVDNQVDTTKQDNDGYAAEADDSSAKWPYVYDIRISYQDCSTLLL